MKALVIAWYNLRRLFRERSNFFFVVILPMILILLLGSVFSEGFTPSVGVFDGAQDSRSRELIAALEATENVEVAEFGSEADLVDAVSRGRVQAGLAVPDGFAATAEGGGESTLRYFGRQDTMAPQLRSAVDAAVARQNLILRSALFTRAETGVPLDQAIGQAEAVARTMPPMEVSVSRVGEDFVSDAGGFDTSASSQLLLFVFLTSLTGSVGLIESRRLGVSRRMISTPTAARTVIIGECLGRYGIALLQGLIIMGGSALFFGVDWGDPLAAAVILLLFALVGAGAGVFVGSVLGSEQQAVSVGLLLGLGSAAIGGSMVPLEIFPDTLLKIAHVTPHAWGNDAFATLLQRDGAISDITTELGLLAAYAATFLSVAAWLFRRRLVTG